MLEFGRCGGEGDGVLCLFLVLSVSICSFDF